jgi:TonB-dependent starch-binding outer membrane protein SusC
MQKALYARYSSEKAGCYVNRSHRFSYKTTLLAMKLTAIILLVACLQVSAGGLAQEVTLSLKNAPLETVFKQIKKQSGYSFIYLKRNLENTRPVSIEMRSASIEAVLNFIFKDQPLTYTISGKYIAIREKPAAVPPVKKDNPPVNITGRIVNDKGEPVAASIIVKGTPNGTTSNADGYFELKNVNENATLIVSGIGIETREIKVAGKTTLSITVKIKADESEVVTINAGYYSVKDRESTGNISKVDAKTIERQPVSNPLQAIQGRMPGVYIQQSTGVPGGGFKVQIRGRNSLRTGSDGGVNGNLPLYLVDGVPFTSTSLTSPSASGSLLSSGDPLSSINPNDIESIEVLKDADATAIYGSRGANGVVLITTKRSKTGKTKFDADVYHGIGQVAHFMDLLSTKQYLTMRKEAFANDAATPDMANAPDLLLWDTTRYTDWQKELIGGTTHTTNAQVSLSGGNERTQFLAGGGYYRETSVFPGDNAFRRVSGRLSVSHQSENKRLRMESAINYSSGINGLPAVDFTGLATSLAPVSPVIYDANGKLNWENSTWTNPLSQVEQKYKGAIDNLVTSASLSYEIIPGLHIKSSFGYTTMHVNENTISPLSAFDPLYLSYGLTGSSLFGESSIKTWIVEPQADYTRKMGDGVLSVLIGATFQQSTQQGKAIQGDGYTNDAFLQNISAATTLSIAENTYSEYSYTAAFARMNYNWKEKYIINLTGRRDGSSRFGPGKRFANFGAVGAAWIFSDEKFAIDHLSFLSFGKLRASYGSTGSDAIGNYQFLQTYSATSYPYAATGGLVLTRLANPDYSWEVNKKFEAGIELGLLKDHIMFSGSFYLNRSSNQLVGLPLPAITGQSSVQFNLPATVQNKGWEFQVSTTNIENANFRWITDLNITLPTNKLIEFPDLEKFPAYTGKYDVGKSIYTYKGYQYNQVDPQTGVYTYVDRNNDGAITYPQDYAAIKKMTQTLFGGMGNSLRYKNIQFDFFFQFVQQNGYGTRISFALPGMISNQPSAVMERWQKPGDNSGIQRFTASDPTGTLYTAYYRTVSSDNLITEASFIRLKNISLSWQLPSGWMKKLKMNGSRIYLQGQNLVTFTKYQGLDPETQITTMLPPLRVLTAGIHLSL